MADVELSLDLETTVPTDLTVSSYSDHAVKKKTAKKSTDVYFKERKEYLRELQLLNNELARKSSLINSLQTELNAKTKSLEEKLKDSQHQKQIIQAKFITQMKFSEEETNRQITSLQNELVKVKQENKKWEELSASIRDSMSHLTLSDEDFLQLRIHASELDLKGYIMLKVHEHIWNLKKENEALRSKSISQEQQLSVTQSQFRFSQKDQLHIREENMKLKEEMKDLTSKLNVIRSRIEHGNYAVENFSRVKNERDSMQDEIISSKKSIDALKVQLLQALQEKDAAKEEATDMKHRYDILQQECSSLSKQLSDVTQKWGKSQDEALRIKSELVHEQTSKEELLHSFVGLREKLKAEYEDRLIQGKKETEATVTQQYEKKIRDLNEFKSLSLRQKESAEKAMIEFKKKYEDLYEKFHEKSVSESDKIKELQKKVEEISSQYQKALINLKNLEVNYREKCRETDKVEIKLQFTEQELESVRKATAEKIEQLETDLRTSKAHLEMFENMDNELSEVISETAQVETDATEALHVIADQISLPAHARSNFIKCVQLTRKIMELERTLLSHQKMIDDEKQKNTELSEQLTAAQNLLAQVEQPYAYFISTLRENESNLKDVKQRFAKAENELEIALKEKKDALEERNNLASDLEKVLINREEITKIRQQLISLQSQRHTNILQRTSGTTSKEREDPKKKPKPKWR